MSDLRLSTNPPVTEPETSAPTDDWDFDALNARARELRSAARKDGLDGLMSEVAGETVRLVRTDEPLNTD